MCVTVNTAFDKLCSATIDNYKTDFVFKKFANKYFLIITQHKKITNLFTVKFDSRSPLADVEMPSLLLTITLNLGEDTDEIRTGITYIINNSNLKSCPTDIIICLGLKEINKKMLQEICTILNTFLPVK